MYKCKVCEKEIHPKRVELGYKDTCVEHSDSKKYYGFNISTSKDTREVQVVKDEETIKELMNLQKTKGRNT